MHSEAMNSNEAVNPNEAIERALDMKIVQALETRPEVAVPSGFAARVASRVPARGPAHGYAARRTITLHPTHYGQWAMAASLVVLAVTLVALLVNGFGDTPIGLAVVWIVYAQLLALAVWFGLRRVNVFSYLWPRRFGR